MKKEPRGSFFFAIVDYRLLHQLARSIKDATVTKDIEMSVADELLAFFRIGRYIIETVGFGVRFGTLYLHRIEQQSRTVGSSLVGIEFDSIVLDGKLGKAR